MNNNNKKQGRDSNTILTNRSQYMTVVTDVPYSRRKYQRYGLLINRQPVEKHEERRLHHKRGSRPLHQTTLTLKTLHVNGNYLSTMKESFSGRSDVAPFEQPTRCPSLHTSQFKVGIDSKYNFVTTCNENFTDYSKHPIVTHEDRARWRKQMAGRDMMNSTRHSNQIDFGTTYSKNHQQITSQHGQLRRPKNGPWRASISNIIKEEPETMVFNSISGDRILYQSRKEPVTNMLCS